MSVEAAFAKDTVYYQLQNGNNTAIISVSFMGCNDVQPVGRCELAQKSNFFIGNDPAKWHVNVPNYAEIVYNNLYEGIDLLFYSTEKGLKYEFTVSPGADPEQIRLIYDGVEKLKTEMDGSTLVAKTNAGELRDTGLMAYQEHPQISSYDDQSINNIPIKFLIDENSIMFNISKYNPNRALIIDPLVYSTFLGGSFHEYGNSIAVDANGSMYISGKTGSSNFPTTIGALNETYNGNDDAFVSKFNKNGSALIYSTFIGGGWYDIACGIAIDDEGYAYISGTTSSNDFPTTSGVNDTTFNNVFDIFMTKLSPEGDNLVYSTFIGGSGEEWAREFTIDSSGNAYITGLTYSSDYPTTPNAYNRTHASERDVFVTKLSPDAQTLVYSTFVGGNLRDEAYGITLDTDLSAYVVGFARSNNFPTTPNAYSTNNSGGSIYGDAFVFKLAPNGSTLHYSTFLGGSEDDVGQSIAVSTNGDAYIVGYTSSDDFPTFPTDAYDTTYNNGLDGFIAKLSTNSSNLLYSTFFGGTDDDAPSSITLDSHECIYVVGNTKSEDFPITIDAYNRTHSSPGYHNDAILVKMNMNWTLIYSTLIGGNDSETSRSVAVDANENVYITGYTRSDDFPTTPNAYNRTHSSPIEYFDAFILQFLNFPTIVNISFSTPIELGSEQNVSLILEHLSPLSSCLIEVNGENQSMIENSYWEFCYNWTPSNAGDVNCRVFFNDTQGSWNVTWSNFTVQDTTAPNLISPSIRSDPLELGEHQWVNVTIFDHSPLTIPPLISINTVNYSMELWQTNIWSYNWTPTTLGQLNWLIYVNDTFQNCNLTMGSFWVNDTKGPTVIRLNYSEIIVAGKIQTINLNLTDFSGISTCLLEISGVNYTMTNDTNTHFYYSWAPSTPGSYTYWIFFNDTQGNWNSAMIQFDVDPPDDGGFRIELLIWIIVIIGGMVAAGLIIRSRRKPGALASPFSKSITFDFRTEMSRRGISREELDKIVALVFKELSGRTEIRIDEVARRIGVKSNILERILVNQICQKNYHGFIEENIFFIEEV